jgi:hypothetical protein
VSGHGEGVMEMWRVSSLSKTVSPQQLKKLICVALCFMRGCSLLLAAVVHCGRFGAYGVLFRCVSRYSARVPTGINTDTIDHRPHIYRYRYRYMYRVMQLQ